MSDVYNATVGDMEAELLKTADAHAVFVGCVWLDDGMKITGVGQDRATNLGAFAQKVTGIPTALVYEHEIGVKGKISDGGFSMVQFVCETKEELEEALHNASGTADGQYVIKNFELKQKDGEKEVVTKGTVYAAALDDLNETAYFKNKGWQTGETDGKERALMYLPSKFNVIDPERQKKLTAVSVRKALDQVNPTAKVEKVSIQTTNGTTVGVAVLVAVEDGDLPLNVSLFDGNVKDKVLTSNDVTARYSHLGGRHRCYRCASRPVITGKHEQTEECYKKAATKRGKAGGARHRSAPAAPTTSTDIVNTDDQVMDDVSPAEANSGKRQRGEE